MIYVREEDDLSCLPLKRKTIEKLRAKGVHTICGMFDEEGLKIPEVEKWFDRLTEVDEEYMLLETGHCLPARSGHLTWGLDKKMRLWIYGRGTMMNYTEGNRPPWYAIRQDIRGVVVERGVVNVGARAFEDCPNLESVMLSGDVKRISAGAFRNCYALDEILTPRVLTHWRAEMFGIPHDNALYVGDKALQNTIVSKTWCLFDDEFFVMNGTLVEYIGHKREVTIPKGIKEIGPMAFEDTPVETVHFPETLERIGVCAFQRTHLKKVTLPAGLRTVAEWAFHDIPELEQVTLLGSRVEIADTAFADTPVAPYARRIDGSWPSLLRLEVVDAPGMEPFRRLVVAPNPVPFGTKKLNVRRAAQELLNDGNILLQYFPDWEKWNTVLLRIYKCRYYCEMNPIRWCPQDLYRTNDEETWVEFDCQFGFKSTSGLSQARRKNLPQWYIMQDPDSKSIEDLAETLLKCLYPQEILPDEDDDV